MAWARGNEGKVEYVVGAGNVPEGTIATADIISWEGTFTRQAYECTPLGAKMKHYAFGVLEARGTIQLPVDRDGSAPPLPRSSDEPDMGKTATLRLRLLDGSIGYEFTASLFRMSIGSATNPGAPQIATYEFVSNGMSQDGLPDLDNKFSTIE